jgi:Nitroreductase family
VNRLPMLAGERFGLPLVAGYPPSGSPYARVPLDIERLDQREMVRRARRFHKEIERRRSVREVSPNPVPRELIELAILAASTAPSSATSSHGHSL